MIDLFDNIKNEAIKKNKENANNMMASLIFQNDKIIDNDTNEEIINITNPNSDLKKFVDEIDKIKEKINIINNNVEQIKDLKNKINLSISKEDENDISVKLNTFISETNELIQKIKIEIQNIRKKYIQKGYENINIKKHMHENLMNVFKKTLYNYQNIQNLYHMNMKEKISRHIKIIYPEYTDDDVQAILNNDEVDTQILIKCRLQGHNNLKVALANVEAKYKDVKILEKSVQDLHQTIIELAALIEMNNAIIENIHDNIKDAQDFTEQANVDLIEAKKIQKKTSKWMCYITLGIAVLIIVVTLPVIIKFT